MNYFALSVGYVANDQFFWIAMATTTILGIFIGAVVYDGLLTQVKKAIVCFLVYGFLIVATDLARIVPIVNAGQVANPQQPFAGVATMMFVTLFYCFGMGLGVSITNKAHSGKDSS